MFCAHKFLLSMCLFLLSVNNWNWLFPSDKVQFQDKFQNPVWVLTVAVFCLEGLTLLSQD